MQGNNKQRILEMFFLRKLNLTQIANKLDISKSAVSQTLKEDNRYLEEKERRKQLNKKKHNKDIQKRVEFTRIKTREKNNADELMMRQMHIQASTELSKRNRMSDKAYRDWNTSAYKYNKDKNRFEFRNELGRSYDVKKYIKGD